jgi:transcriptional regulator with XRE-family HTH domain
MIVKLIYLCIIVHVTKVKNLSMLPKVERQLAMLGENLKLARLRRRLSAAMVAERAGISVSTLWKIEKGEPGVSMAAYAMILFVLGMEQELGKLASQDELGQKLQDLKLVTKKRAPKRVSKTIE